MLKKQSDWNILLIATVAIILIGSISLIGIKSNSEVRGVVEEQFGSQQLLLTKQISAGMETFLNEKVLLLEIMVDSRSGVPDDYFLSDFMSIYNGSGGYYVVEFIDRNGTIVSGYPQENAPIGYNLYEENRTEAFEYVRDTGQTYVTSPLRMLEGDRGSFVWIPVFYEGEFQGAVLGVIKVYDIADVFLKTYDSSGYVYLIDGDGDVLYDGSGFIQRGDNYFEVLNESDILWLDILSDQISGGEGTGKYFESSGDGFLEERMVSYSPIQWKDQVWSVAVSNPMSDVYSLIESVYVNQGFFVGVSGAFILLGGFSIVLLLTSWNKSLEREVEAKTHELQMSNELLQDANIKLQKLSQLKSEFISIVSHELKTPLTAMKTSAEFLKGGVRDPAVEEQMFELIIRNIDRQTRMVDDLLDISRIESGRMSFTQEVTSLYEVVDISVETVKKTSMDKGISIDLELPDDLPDVKTDKDKLMQVFVNLLNNALKFTSDGGYVGISVMELEDHLEIRVRDSGIGIPEEEIDNIFDKFYQVDSTSTRKFGGSGLGLAITKGIVEGQGGSIRVESIPGNGSTFIFTLKK